MENLLYQMKHDMLQLIDLSAEISKFQQMLLHHSDLQDKRNYDADKCEKIKIKVSELQNQYFYLKKKWF